MRHASDIMDGVLQQILVSIVCALKTIVMFLTLVLAPFQYVMGHTATKTDRQQQLPSEPLADGPTSPGQTADAQEESLVLISATQRNLYANAGGTRKLKFHSMAYDLCDPHICHGLRPTLR